MENLLSPSKRHHPRPLKLENPTENDSEVQRKTRLERKNQEQKRYDDEEAASIKYEKRNLSE